MKLDIRVYPDKVLRKKSSDVRHIGDEEKRLSVNMIETMRVSNGIGLAAPQIGINKRIIVVEDVDYNKSALVLVNPVILKKKGRTSFCEGCLSVPEITNDIIRPEHILVEALNIDGDKIRIDTGGLLARVIQHEVDHLDGILFIDRISFLKRKKIIKKLSSNICIKL